MRFSRFLVKGRMKSAMQIQRYKWLTCSILVLLGAVVLGIAARLTIVPRIPPDNIICQKFYFELDSKSIENGWQWDWFAGRQKLDILKLAHEIEPLLRDRLTITTDRQSQQITLSLRCPQTSRNLIDSFPKLISDYAKQQKAGETTGQAAIEAALRKQLKEKNEQYDKQLQNLVLLQSENVCMIATNITLENLEGQNRPSVDLREFDDFVKPSIAKILTEDAELKQLRPRLGELQKKIAQLDIKAGRSDSDDQLQQLKQQRQQLTWQQDEQQQKFNQRLHLLNEKIKNEAWPKYYNKRRTDILKELDANSDKELAMKDQLERMKDCIDLIRSFLPQESAFGTDINIGQQMRQQVVFCPILRHPLDTYTLRSSHSLPQYTIMAIAVLLGGGLGLILGTNNRTARKTTKKPQIQLDTEQATPDDDRPVRDETPIGLSDTTAPAPDNESTNESNQQIRWTKQYDQLAEAAEQLHRQIDSPVILLGAFDHNDGYTRTAVNLAIALTRSSLSKVLLVEADHCSGELADVFELPHGPGFFEWRRGEIWSSKIITETSLPGLSFMPAGLPSAEQLDPKIDLTKERHRWANLRKNYNVILLYNRTALVSEPETPGQIAADQLPDLADGIFACLRSERNSRQIDALLTGRNSQLLGIIPL